MYKHSVINDIVRKHVTGVTKNAQLRDSISSLLTGEVHNNHSNKPSL
jgi:hypothetical protein